MANPYTTNWVSGENFYGRQGYIGQILDSDDRMMLILGTRKIGKTSLLRQIEYLSNPPSYIGVYLDLSGVQTQEYFADRLLFSCSQDKFFEQIQFDVEKFKGESLFEILSELDGKLKKKRTQLILLCDESERFADFDESFLKGIQSFIRYDSQRIRLILTASQGIYKLYDTRRGWTTPPFLHGVPEMTLSRLEDDEAESLIRQIDSEGKSAIEVSDKTVSETQRLTDNQPFLIQCLCSVLYDDGRLLDVTEQHLKQVSESFPLSGVFFDLCKYLSPKQQRVVMQLRETQTMSESELSEKTGLPSYEIKLDLRELMRLCYIKKLDEKYQISNFFFKQWLHSEEADKIGIMEEEDISEMEQLRVLKAIAQESPASIYDIYLSSYLELYKIMDIVEDFVRQKFVKEEGKQTLEGSEVVYYSLTRKGFLKSLVR